MDSEGNGQPIIHKVTLSAQTKTKIVQLHQQLAEAGKGAEFVSNLRAVTQRLQEEPGEFGEPLYHLPALKLTVRQAVLKGLVVDFAVHNDLPLVIVRGIRILP